MYLIVYVYVRVIETLPYQFLSFSDDGGYGGIRIIILSMCIDE